MGVEKVALRSSPRIAKQRSRISVSQGGSMVSVPQEGRAWWPNPAQTSEFIRYFAMFLYTSETPFNKANNRSLKKMGNVVGVTMPNDEVFRTRLLEVAYGRAIFGFLAFLDRAFLAFAIFCYVITYLYNYFPPM